MCYDDPVCDTQAIEHLMRVFGASQLRLGSDYSFAIMDKDPVGRLASLGLSDATHAKEQRSQRRSESP